MKTYKEKKEEIMSKYDEVIRALARANDVDMGIAFDMFKSNIVNDGNYPYIKLDVEEAKKDFTELLEIADAIVNGTK